MPAWAQVAAAMLFLGVAAGLANLDVRHDSNGLSVRTGWMTRASSDAAPKPGATSVARDLGPAASSSAATTGDLAALEQKLRAEFRTVQATGAAMQPALVRSGGAGAPVTIDADTMRKIRALVEQSIETSERRQQNELALRVAQVIRDVNAQRQADLVKIDRNLGYLQTNTSVVSAEALKQREALQRLNYLVSVSQKQ